MALCFQAVQKAYGVFNEIKKSRMLPALQIPAWPGDMLTCDKHESGIQNKK
jgi:hypothetical protein